MILQNAYDTLPYGVFANISQLFHQHVKCFLKLEAFNAAGSIKLKPAIRLVQAEENAGRLRTGYTIIDTTSGNMGVALAVVAKSKKYKFVCVTDEKMTPHNRALVAAYGTELVILPRTTLDDRYEYIRSRIAADSSLVWVRQFTNIENPVAHEHTTALEILAEFGTPNYVFIGVGTGGTIAGCSTVLSKQSPATKIIAVDAEGSAHFISSSSTHITRRIPGIGATCRSPFLANSTIYTSVIVPELDTVHTCELILASTGWLVGGSTGSVVAAALTMAGSFQSGETIVCVSADCGERYLDTIYDRTWIESELILDRK